MRMGSFGDDDDRNEPVEGNRDADFIHKETQVFDSQFSPASSPGEEDQSIDKLHYDVTVPVDNVYKNLAACLAGETQVMTPDDETQVMTPSKETQLMSLAHETQVLNLGGETQLMDYLEEPENMETQLLDGFDNEVAGDSDGEGSDRTEVLSDDDDFGNDGLESRDGGLSPENMKCTSVERGFQVSTNPPVVNGSADQKSRSTPRFTSIRVASLRARGLAAESKALKGTNSGSSSVLTNDRSADQQHSITSIGLKTKFVEETVKVHDCDNYNGTNGFKCKVGSSTVRKLFADDDLLSEDGGLEHNSDNTAVGQEEFHELPACDHQFAGLSYVDSQEPGDLSQANALKVVDMLVEKNDWLEFDYEIDLGNNSNRKTAEPVSTASRGPQRLAKKANTKSTVRETTVYDWDDSREDEGGGDIFCRKKDEFLGSRSSGKRTLSKPKNSKGRKSDQYRECREQTEIMLRDFKKNEKEAPEVERGTKRNLVSELNEQSNMEAIAAKTDVPEMLNVGPDTQMAAEAMEILVAGERIADHDVTGQSNESNSSDEGSLRERADNTVCPKQIPSRKRVSFSNVGVTTRQSKKTKTVGAKSGKDSSVSLVKHAKNIRKEDEMELIVKGTKRASSASKSKNVDKGSSKYVRKRKAEKTVESNHKEYSGCLETPARNEDRLTAKKQKLSKHVSTFTPIACRTRHSMSGNKLRRNEQAIEECREETIHIEFGPVEENRKGNIEDKTSETVGESKNGEPSQPEEGLPELTDFNNHVDSLKYPRRRRSLRKFSGQVNGCHTLDAQSKPSAQPESNWSINGNKNPTTKSGSSSITRKTRSSVQASVAFCSADKSSLKKVLNKSGSKVSALKCSSADANGRLVKERHQSNNINGDPAPSAENDGTNGRTEKSTIVKCKASDLACTPPANCVTAASDVSPVCMGNEYFKQSCKKNLSRSSLMKEIYGLTSTEPEPISPMKDLRKRRDMTSIRVLFSHHLDEDIIKQQKKILARLGASVASTIMDATHFVTDAFVRTRNMLEAIASGKPVVTPGWLKNIGQVKFHIGEEPHLLRDTKKEKEFGFSMPVTLARARKQPLLQGLKVLITQNTKPGKEILSSLVKAVHGQPVERLGKSIFKDEKIPDNILILSCEEDYKTCEPLLEKGAAVYSSELLLNGIVTQKLQFERHRIFADHVKRTRSTLWLRKDGHKFQPVKKLK